MVARCAQTLLVHWLLVLSPLGLYQTGNVPVLLHSFLIRKADSYLIVWNICYQSPVLQFGRFILAPLNSRRVHAPACCGASYFTAVESCFRFSCSDLVEPLINQPLGAFHSVVSNTSQQCHHQSLPLLSFVGADEFIPLCYLPKCSSKPHALAFPLTAWLPPSSLHTWESCFPRGEAHAIPPRSFLMQDALRPIQQESLVQ